MDHLGKIFSWAFALAVLAVIVGLWLDRNFVMKQIGS